MGITTEGTIRWGSVRKAAPHIIKAFNHWLSYRSVAGGYAQYLKETNLENLPIELSEGLIKAFFNDSDIYLVEESTPGGKFSCRVMIKTLKGNLAPQYYTGLMRSRVAAEVDAIEWAFKYMGTKVKSRDIEQFKSEILSVGDDGEQ